MLPALCLLNIFLYFLFFPARRKHSGKQNITALTEIFTSCLPASPAPPVPMYYCFRNTSRGDYSPSNLAEMEAAKKGCGPAAATKVTMLHSHAHRSGYLQHLRALRKQTNPWGHWRRVPGMAKHSTMHLHVGQSQKMTPVSPTPNVSALHP